MGKCIINPVTIATCRSKGGYAYMIRHANKQDIPRIAEIIVFGKRVAYRPIFENDYVSFNELQVVHLYEDYKNNPDRLDGMLLYDDGIVKGIINGKPMDNKTIEITDFYVEPFLWDRE